MNFDDLPLIDPEEVGRWFRKFWIFDAAVSVAKNGGRQANAREIKKCLSVKRFSQSKEKARNVLRRQKRSKN
jgi:hypothetical protein